MPIKKSEKLLTIKMIRTTDGDIVMITWEEYKAHVRNTDTVIARDIDEIEAEAKIISAAISAPHMNKQ